MITVTNTAEPVEREITIELTGRDVDLFEALLNQYEQAGGNANVARLVEDMKYAIEAVA